MPSLEIKRVRVTHTARRVHAAQGVLLGAVATDRPPSATASVSRIGCRCSAAPANCGDHDNSFRRRLLIVPRSGDERLTLLTLSVYAIDITLTIGKEGALTEFTESEQPQVLNGARPRFPDISTNLLS